MDQDVGIKVALPVMRVITHSMPYEVIRERTSSKS